MNGIILQAALSLMVSIGSVIIPLVVLIYVGVLIWHAIEKRKKE